MEKDEVIKAAAFIMRGKNKKAVFLILDEPMMPRDIMVTVFKKKSENAFSIVSRALADLQGEDLVECMNPEEKTGRIWQLTKKGKVVRAFFQKQKARAIHNESAVDI